jgi:formamidase
MHDMMAGRYQLPWQVAISDGTTCGFEPATRSYRGPENHPLVPDAVVPDAVSTLKRYA